jgi:transposase
LSHVFADGGCAGPRLEIALAQIGTWTLEIIKRSDNAEGFELLPRRWMVERTFAWIIIASIKMLARRLARGCSIKPNSESDSENFCRLEWRAELSTESTTAF